MKHPLDDIYGTPAAKPIPDGQINWNEVMTITCIALGSVVAFGVIMHYHSRYVVHAQRDEWNSTAEQLRQVIDRNNDLIEDLLVNTKNKSSVGSSQRASEGGFYSVPFNLNENE